MDPIVDEVSLEEIWASLEEAVGDDIPEPIFPDDRSWFSIKQFQERYGMSRQPAADKLAEWVDRGILVTQTQRRGSHNVRCYRPPKEQE